MIEKDEFEKTLDALASMDLSRPEKIAFGLLIFTKYKRDFIPDSRNAGGFIVQEEEFSFISENDIKELEKLDWEQQTQYLWEFKL